MSFCDGDIRRHNLPRDVFQLIHDLAYDHEGRDRRDYKKRAQKILTSPADLAEQEPVKRKRIGKSDKAKTRFYLEKQLDDLARIICFHRDGNKCIHCGITDRLQWAHVKTRGIKSLRWDPLNNMTLCEGSHLWWHNRPDESGPWFKEKFPERWEHIQLVARNKATVDRRDWLIVLKAEVEKLGSTAKQ